MRTCRSCGEQIHPMRLQALPDTKTCVKCSKEPKKAGRLVHRSEKEDVETTIEFVSPEQYRRIVEMEESNRYSG